MDWTKLTNSPGLKYALIVILVVLCAFIISKTSRFLYSRGLQKWADKGRVDHTSVVFLNNAISFLVFIAASIVLFVSIPSLKQFGITLFAGAGILAAIIGFASQQAFTNIISGFFIVIFKPFRVGDTIMVGEKHQGVVEDITLRHSVIRNYENRRIIIPNSVISSETILNSSIIDEKICIHVEVGISYDSNIDHAISIMRKIVEQHPHSFDNRNAEELAANEPMVVIRVVALAEYSVNLRAYVWTNNAMDAWVLKTDCYKQIKEAFDKEGVEIPFPYMNILQKG